VEKAFSFSRQWQVGRQGVLKVIRLLTERGHTCLDYEGNKEMQRRGVDLWVSDYGWVEVKVDTHDSDYFFLELASGDRPGSLDRSIADFLCFVFLTERRLYFLPLPELRYWLRESICWMRQRRSKWFKTRGSLGRHGTWETRGVVVPKRLVMRNIDVKVVEWKEVEDESERENRTVGDKRS